MAETYYNYRYVRLVDPDPGDIQDVLDDYTGLAIGSRGGWRVHTIDYRGTLCDIVLEKARQAGG